MCIDLVIDESVYGWLMPNVDQTSLVFLIICFLFCSQSYYRAKFLEDKNRVERLFREADAHGFDCAVGYDIQSYVSIWYVMICNDMQWYAMICNDIQWYSMICNWYDVYIAIYMELLEKSVVNDSRQC